MAVYQDAKKAIQRSIQYGETVQCTDTLENRESLESRCDGSRLTDDGTVYWVGRAFAPKAWRVIIR